MGPPRDERSVVEVITRSNFPGCIPGERNLETRARLAELSMGVRYALSGCAVHPSQLSP